MAISDYQLTRPVSVVTPVLSSLAGALRQYIEGLFPDGYFRDYFIDTELPTLRRKRAFRPMSRSQLAQRKLPLLSVRTEATADASEYSTGLSWYTGNRFLQDPSQLHALFMDDHGLRYAGYHSDRIVVRFQLSFVVETEMKAREVMMYLRRVAPVGMKTFLNGISIASEIPGDLLRSVWKDLGFGDGSDPSQVAAFHHYLRSMSAGRIEQVVNSASGRRAYTFQYLSNLVMNISGLPAASSNRDGNVVRTSSVELPIELDVAVPMSYAYRQEARLEAPAGADSLDGAPEMGSSGRVHFSFARAVRPASTHGSLGLAHFTAIVTGEPNPAAPGAPDVTDLSGSIPPEVKAYVAWLRGLPDAGAPTHRAMLWVDGREVTEGWVFDWDTMALTIESRVLRYQYKYHFGIYADLEGYARTTPAAAGSRPPAPSPYYASN